MIGVSGYSHQADTMKSPLSCDGKLGMYPMDYFPAAMISMSKKRSLSIPTVLACQENLV